METCIEVLRMRKKKTVTEDSLYISEEVETRVEFLKTGTKSVSRHYTLWELLCKTEWYRSCL